MNKGDKVIWVRKDGTHEDKGYYYVDEFVSKEGVKVFIVGGMAEGLLFLEESEIELKPGATEAQNTMNVLVDVACSIKYLTEKMDALIPKCPDCGEDMCCGPKPDCCEDEDCDCDDEDCSECNKCEPKLN